MKSLLWILFTCSVFGIIISPLEADAEACGYSFPRNLEVGAQGEDVLMLQKLLNSDSQTKIDVQAGTAGSKGFETRTFGPATARALAKFQNKYASEVLHPAGLASGTGYFGVLTRAKAGKICISVEIQPTISLKSLKNVEYWKQGERRVIEWESKDVRSVNIDLRKNGGDFVKRIVSNYDAGNYYVWTVPTGLDLAYDYTFTVSDAGNPANKASTISNFYIIK
jgi:hypothetical protein